MPAIASPAQTFTTLHIFDFSDGSLPYAGLVQATDGNLYGTTVQGGTNGGGTVFKITPSGSLKTLHSFCSLSGCADGNALPGGLIQVGNGNLYGTTLQGGPNSGNGTVFKITLSGTLTTLHSFDATDGGYPDAGLVQASDGNFYGTTELGGADGEGTIFKITPSGTLTTLHSFADTDGILPRCRAGPRHRWEPLRDNTRGRDQQRGYGLQNHPRRHADHAAQLVLTN